MSFNKIRLETTKRPTRPSKNIVSNPKPHSSFLAIPALLILLVSTYQKTNATPLQSQTPDGLVLPESNWIGERNGLPNDKENEITSDINAPLDRYLNDFEAEAGVDSDEKMENMGGRPKRFTTEFNGMQVSYPQYLRLKALQEKVIRLRA